MIFWILRFSNFAISSDLLDCEISRFSEFVFSLDFQDFEISQFSDFLLSGLVDVWLFWLFEFLGVSVLGCPGFSGVVDFTISWFLDFDDYWCSAFFGFWTLGIFWDSGVWL